MPKTKEEKRKSAQERQEKYTNLSLAQKLAKATPGSKEHKKLLAAKEQSK